MQDHSKLRPLETLFEAKHGRAVKLTPNLTRLYGNLRVANQRSRQHVFSNFVSTLDGVVSLQIAGHAGGADISGSSVQDRMVMGLLRATADIIIVGSGTLAADPRHIWTPDGICPELADDYRTLRMALRRPATPLNVIVSGSGQLDLKLPVFASGRVRSLIVTTMTGARNLWKQKVPRSLEILGVPHGGSGIAARSILKAVGGMKLGKRVLIEGGPRLLGDFYAERLVDEQFLTIAPQVVGREDGDGRLGLVMDTAFPPGRGRWGTLTEIRRGASQLFLRYTFRSAPSAAAR
jgi:riboflavin biosynthesis pyrimidine reductase